MISDILNQKKSFAWNELYYGFTVILLSKRLAREMVA